MTNLFKYLKNTVIHVRSKIETMNETSQSKLGGSEGTVTQRVNQVSGDPTPYDS